MRHTDVGAIDIGGPHLLHRGSSTYVVHDIGSGGNLMITEVGNDFSKRHHLAVFHAPLPGTPGNGRSAASSFGTYQGREYVIYEAGARPAGGQHRHRPGRLTGTTRANHLRQQTIHRACRVRKVTTATAFVPLGEHRPG